MDAGSLDHSAVESLVRQLRDAALLDRARRLAAYVGGTDEHAKEPPLPSRARAPRFALGHSDLDVLRARHSWQWRARSNGWGSGARRNPCFAAFRPIIWPCTRPGRMRRECSREKLLHALRLALIHRIWLLATKVPEFSPRHGVTHQVLISAILRLEIPAALTALAEIFPEAPEWGGNWDYAEPHAPRGPRAMRASAPKYSTRCASYSTSCARSPPQLRMKPALSDNNSAPWPASTPARESAHRTGTEDRFRCAGGLERFVLDCQHRPSTKTSTRRSTLSCQPGWSCM